MATPAEATRRSTPRRFGALGLGVLVTAALLTATVLGALAWRARAEDDQRHAFQASATQVERRLAADLGRVHATVVSLASQVGEEPALTADVFSEEVLRSIPVEVPTSVVTLAVVEPVADDQVASLVAERRADGLLELQVREPGTGELAVATFERSGGALPFFDGLDLSTLPAAQAALGAAAASGRPTTSGVLERLPSDEASLLRSGFLAVAPIRDALDADVEGAWVVALVDGEHLLERALAGADPGTEAQLVRPEGELVASTARSGATVTDLGTVAAAWRESARVGGAGPFDLTVAVLDPAEGAPGSGEAAVVLLVGSFVAVLLGALVWALARARTSALALAASATDTLRQSEEQFRSVVQNLSDIVLLLDEAGTVRYASPSVRELLGWTPKTVVGSSIFDGLHGDDERSVRQAMVEATVREPGLPAGSRRLLEVRLRHADGRFREFEATVSDVVDADLTGLVFTAHDVSHRVAAEERLAHEATHDPLTHLPNRTLLDDRLSHALDRSRRTGAQVAVLFLDLDGFKDVNDTWGHAAGDRVLTEVAGRLGATARASDTVARIGGDEFVVVCEEAGSSAGAQTLAGRLLEAITMPVEVSGVAHQVGASVGIALASPDDRDAAELLRRADAAMYRAKQAGRGRIEVDRSDEPERPVA